MVTVSKLTFGATTSTDDSVGNARDSFHPTRESALIIASHSLEAVKA
ncbi:hypothetical protein [Acidovorax sp. HMWF018]|nr:hypothetical protein [Acidovorax sp. HMWF018]